MPLVNHCQPLSAALPFLLLLGMPHALRTERQTEGPCRLVDTHMSRCVCFEVYSPHNRFAYGMIPGALRKCRPSTYPHPVRHGAGERAQSVACRRAGRGGGNR